MIRYYITETFSSIKRAKLAAFFTTFTITIAIMLGAASLSMFFISEEIGEILKSKIRMTIFLEPELTENEVTDLRSLVEKDSTVLSVQFLSREEAREQFIKETGEDFSSILEDNPLPPSFTVIFRKEMISSQTLDRFVKDCAKIEGVDEINYDYDFVINIFNFLDKIKLVVVIISSALILLGFYLVYSTGRLITDSRREQYRNMKLAGASLSAIRMPVIFSSLIFGIVASALSILFYYFIVIPVIHMVFQIDFGRYFNFIAMFNFFLGVILSLAGSIPAAGKQTLEIKNL